MIVRDLGGTGGAPVTWTAVSLPAVGGKDIGDVFLAVPRICTILTEIKKGVRTLSFSQTLTLSWFVNLYI